MIRRLGLIVYAVEIIAGQIWSADLPQTDPRNAWNCAYPYTETTCQAVLLSWAKDHDQPWETIFAGADCAGCEPHYQQDQNDYQHLVYAECQNRFGARFTSNNLITPITRFKQASGDNPGWSVSGWSFNRCFETWQCSQYCSLTQYPPHCIKFRSTNWGLYQPNTQSRCEAGSQPDEQSLNLNELGTESPNPMQSEPVRDKTWQPAR